MKRILVSLWWVRDIRHIPSAQHLPHTCCHAFATQAGTEIPGLVHLCSTVIWVYVHLPLNVYSRERRDLVVSGRFSWLVSNPYPCRLYRNCCSTLWGLFLNGFKRVHKARLPAGNWLQSFYRFLVTNERKTNSAVPPNFSNLQTISWVKKHRTTQSSNQITSHHSLQPPKPRHQAPNTHNNIHFKMFE